MSQKVQQISPDPKDDSHSLNANNGGSRQGQAQSVKLSEFQRHIQQSLIKRQQQKSQNPKIGRPAKTNQQEQFKLCYMQNKQKFELECQLLVYIHQAYFDEIIDNPINARLNKQSLDAMFITHKCEDIYRTLLLLNQRYFKNSSAYPEQKLRYTSLVDVAYMCRQVKEKHGPNLSCTQILNEKLINQSVYDYFANNWQKLREGMIFGPAGANPSGPNCNKFRMEKLDKLIICLALTLAERENITIEEEVETYQVQEQEQVKPQKQARRLQKFQQKLQEKQKPKAYEEKSIEKGSGPRNEYLSENKNGHMAQERFYQKQINQHYLQKAQPHAHPSAPTAKRFHNVYFQDMDNLHAVDTQQKMSVKEEEDIGPRKINHSEQ